MADKDHKVVNFKTMEEEILNNPEVYQTTFIVRQSYWKNSSDPIYYIELFIGKDKIKALQIMTINLMLVTMNSVDDMNDLLASVSYISIPNPPYSSRPKLHFKAVLPVPARVRIKISGIPLPLASGNLNDIKELVIALISDLKEVVLSMEKKKNIYSGNLIVDALTDDLKTTHGKLRPNEGITYKNFHGTVKFIKSFPAREESKGKYITHSGIEVEPWPSWE